MSGKGLYLEHYCIIKDDKYLHKKSFYPQILIKAEAIILIFRMPELSMIGECEKPLEA